ncbi:MAG: tetratricopeptide repeat protein [Sphingobacteriales bacterium]|nr:tetratricopeptide repeat protein [Sphingobacteriales bacterium]
MKLFSFITMLLAVMNYSYGNESVISPQKEKAIRLLLYDEQTVSALKTFTQEITKSGQQKNTTETADNIYWISECLFRLKKLTFLDTLLQTGILFTQKNNADAFSKLKIIEGKSLIEKGKYKECIRMLTELSTQIKDITLLCEIRLTMADANQRLQLLNQSKLHYDYVLKTATDAVQKARANNGLGSYYCILSDFDSAILFYNIAFKQFQQELGEQHSRIGQVHYNLGLIADRKFDLYEAELHFTKALQLYKKRLGDLHPRTAETYGSLGSLFFMKDNPGKALYYSVKERDILLQLYGKDNPDLAYSYLNCGKIYYLLGDKIQSEQQLLLAIDLVKKYFGVNHNLYPQCIDELSKIYTDRKQFSEAEKILYACIKLKQNNPDELLADLYLQLAQNYLRQHKTENAHKYFALANKIYINVYGDKNTHSVEAVLGLSDCFLQKEDFKTAYSYAHLAFDKTTQNNKKSYYLMTIGNVYCVL